MNETDTLSIHNERDVFYTGSLNVVAYLMTKGVDYIDIKISTGRKLFEYEKNENLQKILNEYNQDHFIRNFVFNLRKAKEAVKSKSW